MDLRVTPIVGILYHNETDNREHLQVNKEKSSAMYFLKKNPAESLTQHSTVIVQYGTDWLM